MVKLKLLGTPSLTDGNNTIIPLKNRKELALLAYLARIETAEARRDVLANTLWSRGTDAESRMSLRQAVKNLRKVENKCGVRLLATNRASVGLTGPATRTDVNEILTTLSNPRAHTLKKARSLLPSQWKAADRSERRSAFLFGYDNLDPVFETWRQSEAEAIRICFTELANDKIDRLTDPGGAMLPELTRFLLALDPADEWAHHLLILHLLATGAAVRATRQFEKCAQELADHLGTKPSTATAELLKSPKHQLNGRLPSKSAFYSNPEPASGSNPAAGTFAPVRHDLPIIQYVSPPTNHQHNTALSEEYVEQIERNRDFVLLHAPSDLGPDKHQPRPPINGRVHLGIDDNKGGQFLLRTKEDTGTGAVMVELRFRDDGKPVFTDIITAGPAVDTDDRKYLISRSVLMLERKIADFYRRDPVLQQSMFSKFLEVDELTGRFDKKSSDKATAILDRIENKVGESSLSLAFRASIHLQDKLLMQSQRVAETSLALANELASRALKFDPWHLLNHRYLGFAACYLGRQAEGQEHMLAAQALNPQDPRQMIATAEAAAFADTLDLARTFSDAARGLNGETPRYFYGYQANIAFASGDFEAAVTFASQAPPESMDYRATRIAALWQLDRATEARNEMQNSLKMLQSQNTPMPALAKSDVITWMCDLNPFANAQTLARFRQGIRGASLT